MYHLEQGWAPEKRRCKRKVFKEKDGKETTAGLPERQQKGLHCTETEAPHLHGSALAFCFSEHDKLTTELLTLQERRRRHP